MHPDSRGEKRRPAVWATVWARHRRRPVHRRGIGGDGYRGRGRGGSGSAGAGAAIGSAGGGGGGRNGNNGAAAAGGGGGGTGTAGSACADGAPTNSAAIAPRLAEAAVNTFASISILTDAPFPQNCPKSVHWVLQFDYQNCYTCARCDQEVNNLGGRNTFYFGVFVTGLNRLQLWCSNGLPALDNVI